MLVDLILANTAEAFRISPGLFIGILLLLSEAAAEVQTFIIQSQIYLVIRKEFFFFLPKNLEPSYKTGPSCSKHR